MAGFPKCGSTALASYLGQHRDIAHPLKEPYSFLEGKKFYGEEGRSPFLCIPQDSRREVVFGNNKDKNYIMDSSIGYFWRLKGKEFKQKIKDEAKILFCIRNPIDRIKSTYFFSVYWKASVEEWLTNEPSLYLYFSYYPFIKDYTEAFGKENVRVVLSEELRERPQEVCNQIFDWLGLERIEIKKNTINKTYPINNPRLIRKIKKITNSLSRWAVQSPFKEPYLKLLEILATYNLTPTKIIGRVSATQKNHIELKAEVKEFLFKDYMRTMEYCHKREILLTSQKR